MEENLFKRKVKKRKRTKTENSVLSLVEKITELNEILPYIADPIDKNSMKYLSTLHSETAELIKGITWFVVFKKYCGIRENFDNCVIKVQELIGVLKEFKRLDTSRKKMGLIDEASKAEASLYLQSLKSKMKELMSITIVPYTESEVTDINQDWAHCISMSFFYLLKFPRSSI